MSRRGEDLEGLRARERSAMRVASAACCGLRLVRAWVDHGRPTVRAPLPTWGDTDGHTRARLGALGDATAADLEDAWARLEQEARAYVWRQEWRRWHLAGVEHGDEAAEAVLVAGLRWGHHRGPDEAALGLLDVVTTCAAVAARVTVGPLGSDHVLLGSKGAHVVAQRRAYMRLARAMGWTFRRAGDGIGLGVAAAHSLVASVDRVAKLEQVAP